MGVIVRVCVTEEELDERDKMCGKPLLVLEARRHGRGMRSPPHCVLKSDLLGRVPGVGIA